MVEAFEFYTFSDGRKVNGYRITNHAGEYAVFLDYGAMIQKVCVLDRKGDISDVVMGPCETDFEDGKFSGSILGRCANRIAYGHFVIDNKEYQLNTVNQNPGAPHHLHGGKGALSKKFFHVSYEPEGQRVVMTCVDEGEDGWGTTALVKVTYTFDDDHKLTITYDMSADGDTVLCPSNHVHFNLDMPREVADNQVRIYADSYAPKEESLGMPAGETASVEGLPIDFRRERSFTQAFDSDKSGFLEGRKRFDVCYLLPGKGFRKAAKLSSPTSGRCMTVWTDMQCLILFTPVMPRTMMFKGMEFKGMMAVCCETQFVPNAVNCPGRYESPVFRKGETLHSCTAYTFGTEG